MSQNVDLIQILADVSGGVTGCSDCDGRFMQKTDSVFTSYVKDTNEQTKLAVSGDSATFTLGKVTSTDVGTLTVQGSTDADAVVYVKSNDGSQTTITPINVSAETLTISGAVTTGALTVAGHLLPSAPDTWDIGDDSPDKRWHNIYAENLDLDGTFNAVDLTLSGNLVVNGNTTLGNAASDDVTITGTATFAEDAEFNGGINCDGALVLEANNISGTNWSVTGSSGAASFGSTVTISGAPTGNTHAVRKTDVDMATGTGLSASTFKMAKFTIDETKKFITDAKELEAADLLTHANNHKTTSLTGSSPAVTPPKADPLVFSEIGATGRQDPVVKSPLKITTSDDYTYSTAKDYFVVIAAGTPAPEANGPVGQIIFRRAT